MGLGHLLALSPSGELNTLAAARFQHEFGPQRLFALTNGQESRRSDKHRASHEYRGQALGNPALTYGQLASELNQGAELYSTNLTDNFTWDDYLALHGKRVTLLFARDNTGWVHVVTADSELKPGTGWTLLALIRRES